MDGPHTRANGAEGRATVLVVDDDPQSRFLAVHALEGCFTVVEAADAASAQRALTSARVDLILLDVQLGAESGLEVCGSLKRAAGDAFLPVLLLTAFGDHEARLAGLGAGADDFLSKPVDPHELRLRVGAFLRIRQQEQIIRAQLDELRQLAQLKDDLVALFAHDLRNPLGGLLAYLHLARDETDDPAVREDVQGALQATHRLREGIDDMLQTRLLEAGRATLARESALPSEVILDAVATVEAVARERRVQLVLPPEASPPLQLDRKLIRRALENLLANAIRYSSPGGTVTVGLRSVQGGVEIDVADRGAGIADEHKEHLFEKFASVEAARGGTRRGFGLGLYLVRLVAAAHAGAVRVRDRAGGGTVFSLFLPASPSAARALPEPCPAPR